MMKSMGSEWGYDSVEGLHDQGGCSDFFNDFDFLTRGEGFQSFLQGFRGDETVLNHRLDLAAAFLCAGGMVT